MSEKTIKILRIILLAAFFIMFIYGMINGEMETVLMKARNICMECIGIG